MSNLKPGSGHSCGSHSATGMLAALRSGAFGPPEVDELCGEEGCGRRATGAVVNVASMTDRGEVCFMRLVRKLCAEHVTSWWFAPQAEFPMRTGDMDLLPCPPSEGMLLGEPGSMEAAIAALQMFSRAERRAMTEKPS